MKPSAMALRGPFIAACATLLLAACDGRQASPRETESPPVDACLVVTEIDLEREVFADPGVAPPDFRTGRRSVPETTAATGTESGCVYSSDAGIEVSATVRREASGQDARVAFDQAREEAVAEGGLVGAQGTPYGPDSFSVGFPEGGVALWVLRDVWVVAVRLDGVPASRDVGALAIETMRSALLNLFGEEAEPPEATIPPPATASPSPSPNATAT